MAGNTFGRSSLGGVGRSMQLLANQQTARFKPGGITLDWGTVATNNTGSNIVWDDGVIVEPGSQGLRFGQCLCRISAAEVQTVTFVGTPSSGNFVVWGQNPFTGVGQNYSLPYNPTTAQFQTAMDTIFGAGNTVVGGTTGTGPFTITTAGALAFSSMPLLAFDVTNDGGTGGYNGQGAGAGLNAGVTVGATISAGANSGMYGPYDTAATDGRQTLARGSFYWLNESVIVGDTLSNHPGVIEGGLVWKDRLIATTGTHSLILGPTFAEFEPLMPGINYVVND
jgi:hypothetical protein